MTINRIEINPAVLVWAREGLALSQDDLARACGVDPERISSWESGDQRPTYRQLALVARKVLRDPAFFVRDEPPTTSPPAASFRRLFGSGEADASYELLRSLEKARGVALAFRLRSLGPATSAVVGAARTAAGTYTERTSEGGNFYRTHLRNVGYRFAETVMEALVAGEITRRSAASMLGTSRPAGIERLHEALSARG